VERERERVQIAEGGGMNAGGVRWCEIGMLAAREDGRERSTTLWR
jgi:hypothetical protein